MSADLKTRACVKARHNLSGNIVSLELVASNGAALPDFEAGAHIDVATKVGITRQYSLCGDPAETGIYRLGVLNEASESRGGSRSIYEDLNDGDEIEISGPTNHFPLIEDAKHTTLVGGGIGITPLISMGYALKAANQSFSLHYCVADESRAAFLPALLESGFAEHVHLHCSRSNQAPKFDLETDIPAWEEGYHFYVCGPNGFMDWVLEGATSRGYGADFQHKEDFGADVDPAGGAFEVEARQSGLTFTVAEGETIANALAREGVHVQVSCEEGVCGTCLSDVLEGVPDHRDAYLTDEEREAGDMILVCCSRAKSGKLVLDL